MDQYYLKEMVRQIKKNNIFTGAGVIVGLVALVIALIALMK